MDGDFEVGHVGATRRPLTSFRRPVTCPRMGAGGSEPREGQWGVPLRFKVELGRGRRVGAGDAFLVLETYFLRPQTCPEMGREGPSPRELRFADVGVSWVGLR